jgi:microsomal dipeptidase-like Zn-dependent dipeptidase
MLVPVIDLHNDLLSYLASGPSLSPYDAETKTSIDQMRKGNVRGSILVAFCPTPHKSLRKEMRVKNPEHQLKRQVDIFCKLPEKYPEAFSLTQKDGTIAIALGIENCSTFIGEKEPLELGIRRFQRICRNVKPSYVSLTWNEENRLGGGTPTKKGLTEEGKVVIDLLGEHTTAIDLSHASDQLSMDVFNYLEHTKSPLKVIASHANFRAITDVPRNLPDEVAMEIARRGGVIGLTLIRSFIGPSDDYFFRHIEHALSKGWGNALALGADYFSKASLPEPVKKAFVEEHFFPRFPDASCYPSIQDEITRRFGQNVCKKMFFENPSTLFFH